MGKATDFEFRYRFWLIGMLFALAFSVYWIDHQNAAAAIVQLFMGARADTHTGRLIIQSVFALGALIILLAGVLRTWATAYLRSEVVHDLDLHSEGLVADGPYRHVRNPLYLGTFLMSIGMGLLASRLGFVLLVIGMLIYGFRLIAREEGALLASQGESFRAFCAAVPRFLPALRPRVPAGNTQPRWLQALWGESIFYCFACAMLVFAITLRAAYLQAIMWAALIGYTIAITVWKRRQSQS